MKKNNVFENVEVNDKIEYRVYSEHMPERFLKVGDTLKVTEIHEGYILASPNSDQLSAIGINEEEFENHFINITEEENEEIEEDNTGEDNKEREETEEDSIREFFSCDSFSSKSHCIDECCQDGEDCSKQMSCCTAKNKNKNELNEQDKKEFDFYKSQPAEQEAIILYDEKNIKFLDLKLNNIKAVTVSVEMKDGTREEHFVTLPQHPKSISDITRAAASTTHFIIKTVFNKVKNLSLQ